MSSKEVGRSGSAFSSLPSGLTLTEPVETPALKPSMVHAGGRGLEPVAGEEQEVPPLCSSRD